MIERIFLVMTREFVATVGRRAFLIGVVVMPALGLVLLSQLPRLLTSHGPQVSGEVALIDPTGRIGPQLRHALDPVVIAQRRATARRTGPGAAGAPAAPAPGAAVGPIPLLSVVPRQDPGLDAGKDWLRASADVLPRHLALVVVHPDAVVRRSGQADYGSYDLYVTPRVDQDTESTLREAMREALVAGRLASGGIDPAAVETMLSVASPDTITVAAEGERSGQNLARALPFICGLLLFIGVFVGGQTLLAITVEEKSSRVMEVLLAAVSPLELMWGKLLAQLGVGLLTMAIYVGMGLFALLQLSMAGLVQPGLILQLLAFYLVTYLVFGALMLAIGAAISNISDAQSMMGPVMMLMLIPYVLTPVFGRQPNAPLTVTLSFIPPFNSFAMLARLASGTPPPLWQATLSLAAGVVVAAATVWFAAKVFRVGLLMHGKPPSFATLIKWARMA
ncbi:MAG TPA: ABC transporter permease [Steroidobacteraceae bacterium]|nr:ABC transporter permease [Steroidobacteraceae bacterium]